MKHKREEWRYDHDFPAFFSSFLVALCSFAVYVRSQGNYQSSLTLITISHTMTNDVSSLKSFKCRTFSAWNSFVETRKITQKKLISFVYLLFHLNVEDEFAFFAAVFVNTLHKIRSFSTTKKNYNMAPFRRGWHCTMVPWDGLFHVLETFTRD